MKKEVLVTGANGFIGIRLCQLLQQQGLNVRTLTHRRGGDNVSNYLMDLATDDCPVGLFEGIDTVFHLAGKAHDLAQKADDTDHYWQINVEGTRKLLEAARLAGVKRFVFFSSVKAQGEATIQPMNESDTTPACSSYGQSKYAAEQLVLHGGYVPHPVVIRPCMVYGNTEKGNLPVMIKAIKRGWFPPLPEFGNKRSMVHVDDVIQVAMLAAENPKAAGQIFIVSDGQAYSTRQIYDWIRLALGKAPASWEIPMVLLSGLAKCGDLFGRFAGRRFLFDSDALHKLTGSAWYSSAKIEHELGFKPTHTLNSSLLDIVRYLSDQ